MIDAPAPSLADPHLATSLRLEADQAVRVTVETAPEPEGWCQVLNSFIDEQAPRLSAGPLKVMLALFRCRDRFTGRSRLARADLILRTLLSKAAVSEALSHLTRAGLLAQHGPDEFEVMPGRVWAGRRHEPPPVRRGERLFAAANACSPPRTASVEERTREVSDLPDQTGRRDPDPARPASTEAGGARAGRGGQGGRSPLFDPSGEERLAGALRAAEIQEPAFSMLMDLSDLTADEVLRTAREVWEDPTALVKPACVASRLLRRRSLSLPKGAVRARLGGADFGALEGVARRRQQYRDSAACRASARRAGGE